MQAIILAAGLGTRLKSQYKNIPKGLIKLGGREIIYRTICFLKNLGIKDFILVTNNSYYSHYENFFKKNFSSSEISYQIILNPHPERGNGYSLYLAKKYIKDSFIVVMSDHIYEEAFIKKAINGKGLVIDKKGLFIEPTEATKVRIKNGYIEDIGKKLNKWDGFDTGFFILNPDIFSVAENLVSQKEVIELSDIVKLAHLPVTEISGFLWMDIDTPQDLKKARKFLIKIAVKGTGDGIISRTLNRKISTRISLYLADKITPNQATLLAFLIGILSSVVAFFHLPAGGLVYQLSSIIDGVDGEIARLTLKESKFGGWLDSLLDRFVDFFFLLALAHFVPYSFWPVVAFAIIGSVMVSYSTERFKAAYSMDIYKEIPSLKYFIGKRDERIFLIMIFCLLKQIKLLFIILAILTNLRVFLTILLVKNWEEKRKKAT